MKHCIIACLCAFFAYPCLAQWTNNGNKLTTTDLVGIGTTNPHNRLEIGKAFSLHDGGHKIIGFGWANGSGGDLNTSQYASEIRLDPVAGKMSWGVSSTVTSAPVPSMFLTREGRLGIGTGSPRNLLQIGNAFSFHDGGHKIIGFGWAHGGSNGDLNTAKYAGEIRMDPNAGDLSLGVSATVNSAPITTLTVTKNQRVGIGTENPDHLLTVAGKIHARSIECTVNAGADFVFEEDYPLLPLAELDAFVTAHKHLPEIAPAEEMETEGIVLEEMNIRLLQKIEELTLYTLQQQKEIEQLKQAMKAIKAAEK